jgi:hypothetical protein
MKYTITLPNELNSIVQTEAKKAGLTPSEYVQLQVDAYVKKLLRSFVADETNLTEEELSALHVQYALAKLAYLEANRQ